MNIEYTELSISLLQLWAHPDPVAGSLTLHTVGLGVVSFSLKDEEKINWPSRTSENLISRTALHSFVSEPSTFITRSLGL